MSTTVWHLILKQKSKFYSKWVQLFTSDPCLCIQSHFLLNASSIPENQSPWTAKAVTLFHTAKIPHMLLSVWNGFPTSLLQ